MAYANAASSSSGAKLNEPREQTALEDIASRLSYINERVQSLGERMQNLSIRANGNEPPSHTGKDARVSAVPSGAIAGIRAQLDHAGSMVDECMSLMTQLERIA